MEGALFRDRDGRIVAADEMMIPAVHESETLGSRLMGVVAGAVKRLWSTSYTVLTVDLKRASISYRGPPLLTRRSRSAHHRGRFEGGPSSAFTSPYEIQQANEQALADLEDDNKQVETSGAQARLKMMQVWALSKNSIKDEWQVNLGIGGEFELERGELKPKLRLRAKRASLHLLPHPLIELRHKWPFPLYTHLGIDIRCRIPLTSPDRLFDSSAGARLMINVFNLAGSGIHFTPGGLLLEENVIELGRYTRMRVAAALEFPRELPWSDDERPFKLEIRRVGIKARTL